jgi:hypothetical protein
VSITQTWVMADDGMLRRDPVVRGEDRITGAPYFLCFDDNEPPELVICTAGRSVTDEDAQVEAERIVDDLGITAIVGRQVMRATRCFSGDAACGPYRKAVSVWLDILQPLPARLLTGRAYPQPRGGSCVVFSFGRTWG